MRCYQKTLLSILYTCQSKQMSRQADFQSDPSKNSCWNRIECWSVGNKSNERTKKLKKMTKVVVEIIHSSGWNWDGVSKRVNPFCILISTIHHDDTFAYRRSLVQIRDIRYTCACMIAWITDRNWWTFNVKPKNCTFPKLIFSCSCTLLLKTRQYILDSVCTTKKPSRERWLKETWDETPWDKRET